MEKGIQPNPEPTDENLFS